jgi:hypothetical protein
MLEKVGDAAEAVVFVGGAGVHPDVEGDDFVGYLLKDNSEAIVEAVLLQ